MEFKNLEGVGFEVLFRGFERAFFDYEIRFEKEEVRSMLRRRGYNPRFSFAAFDNDEIVAFTLNGTGMFNGIPTAYDTGTGTVREYRGRGFAGKVFNYSLPYLKESGIGQYLLEVLQNNGNAIAVYRRMNFEITREFGCFRQTIANLRCRKSVLADCIIEPVGIDFVRKSQFFCDFRPSWQNCIASIERGEAGLIFLGARIGNMPAGYCVCDPYTGDLAQIAVKKEFRRRGIASRLLDEAVKRPNTDFLKIINVDADCRSLSAFLESLNIPLASKQFEMMRPL